MIKKLVLVLFVSLFLLGVAAVWAFPISVCDYSPPESKYTALSLGFNYRYFEDATSDEGDINIGNLNFRYDNLFNSPSYGYNLSARSTVTYNQGTQTPGLSYEADTKANYKMYLTEGDLFAFGGVKMVAASEYTNLGINVTTGSGYGRFRDVTPLGKAMRINEMLIQKEIITETLPDDILTQIAQQIGRKVEYEDVKTLVSEIAKIIEGTNLVKEEALGSIEVLRIREIVEETTDRKLCGWDVKGGLGYEILNPRGPKRDFLLNASFNYALAYDPYSQFRVNSDFTSSFDVFNKYSLTSLIEYTYRVTRTISTDVVYSYSQRKSPDSQEVTISHNISANLTIQLEENLNMSVNLSGARKTNYEEWEKGLSVSMNYDLF